jgi:hypothetical protein
VLLGRIPVGNDGGSGSVLDGRREGNGAMQWEEEGNVTRFVAALVHRREGTEWRKGGPRLGSELRW